MNLPGPEPDLRSRMRAAVADAVTASTARLRTLPAPALVGLLSASALTPVITAALGAGVVITAGAGVAGSLGANVLTDVVTEAIARLRDDDAKTQPAIGPVQSAVADRITAAFRAASPADRDLRGEVITLFQAVDVAGTALQTAAQVDDADLVRRLVGAFSDLTAVFGEFAFVLVASRLSLEALHQDVRREVVRQDVDRERARDTQADIGRILDAVRDLQTRAASPDSTGGAGHPRWDGCPYRGLLPFEERHAPVFYGRRALTSRLLRRMADHLSDRPASGGLLLVLGPSGAGKSSLLRAGLAAALADDRLMPGSRLWPRRVLTPTADPIRQLATHLADLAGTDAVSVYRSLIAHPEQAHLLAGQTLSRLAEVAPAREQPRLVLVVDQLEEMFTLAEDRSAQDTFVTALHAMSTRSAPPGGYPTALVIASIRSDALDQAVTFPALRDAVEAGPFTVGAMSESELQEAITGPAAEAGVTVPAALTDAILDDLRDRSQPTGFDAGALPLLSQAMFVMWQANPSMTLAGYRRTGGVAGIVHASAERVYQDLSEAQRDLTRRVFVHLTAAVDGRLTRRPATHAALGAAVEYDGGELDLVLEAFTAQRLIMRTDSDLVTVAHEELLRSWTRLRDWLQPSLTDQALHRALIEDAQAWLVRHRDPSYLYHGGQLIAVGGAVRRWAADPAGHLAVDASAAEFLTVSRRRDRRRRRVAQTVAAGIALLLVIAVGTTAFALRAAARADRQHALALSRQLATQSRATTAIDPAVSERLAAAALRTAHTDEAAEAASAALLHFRSVFRQARPVSAVGFSPDGQMLATAATDGTVRLWNPTTGAPIGVPLHAGGNVAVMAFSPDGQMLATAATESTVRLWNPTTGAPIGVPLHAGGNVAVMAFSPGGQLLATADSPLFFGRHNDAAVRLWDPATGTPVGAPLNTGVVTALAFSADGQQLATADTDGTARLWHPATGTPAGSAFRHTDPASAMAFSPDGQLLAAGNADDGTVRLWHPLTGAPVGRPLNTGPASAVAFSPDGRLLATTGGDYGDGVARLWNVAVGAPVGPALHHPGKVWAVAFSPDGRLLATADTDGAARLWNPATGTPGGGPLHIGLVSAVAFSPDGRLLATGGGDRGDGVVQLWNVAIAVPVGPALHHPGQVTAVAFSPDGRLLATADDDGTARLWNPATGAPVGAPLHHSSSLTAVAFSPDGRLLATAGLDGTARLWNPATGTPVGAALRHSAFVNAVTFSPDGRLLATGNADNTARLWNPATGTPVGAPLRHSSFVTALTFSPNGHLLATGDIDGTVRLWNPATGTPVRVLTRRVGWVSAVAFSPDGRILATADLDNTVRLWDPATGAPVGAPLTGHTESVQSLAFSPDGRLLATGGGDGTRLWNREAYADPVRSLCQRAGGPSRDEWATYAPGEPFVNVCP